MAYPIEPEQLHAHLINAFHGSMAHPHVSAQRKSSYAKILAMLAQDQAQAHAGQSRQPSASPGQMGGVQAPEDTGLAPGYYDAPPGSHVAAANPSSVIDILRGQVAQRPTAQMLHPDNLIGLLRGQVGY